MTYFGIMSQFVNPSWLFTFLTRVIGFELVMCGFWIHRWHTGDDINYAMGIGTAQLAVIILEFANYLNNKQKLHLFVRMKKSQQQEKQLSELLDAVPDCVFICSKDTDVEKS